MQNTSYVYEIHVLQNVTHLLCVTNTDIKIRHPNKEIEPRPHDPTPFTNFECHRRLGGGGGCCSCCCSCSSAFVNKIRSLVYPAAYHIS
jgi:hypothetical protein